MNYPDQGVRSTGEQVRAYKNGGLERFRESLRGKIRTRASTDSAGDRPSRFQGVVMNRRFLLFVAVLLVVPGFFMAPAAPSEGIAVSGRVLASGGGSVADVAVLLLPSLDPVHQARLADSGALPKPATRAVTDGTGRFLLTAPHAGLFRVRVQAPGFVPIEASLEPLIETIDLPDAELVPDAGFTVKVTTRGGAPIPGARVRIAGPDSRARAARFDAALWQPAVRTAIADEKGATFLPRGANERSVLTASAPGYLPVERRNLWGTAAVLTLERGAKTTIAVRSADGTPAPGVLVIASELSHPLGFTDTKGLLELVIPAKGGLRVALAADDGRRVEGRVTAAPETSKGGRGTSSAEHAAADRADADAKTADSGAGAGTVAPPAGSAAIAAGDAPAARGSTSITPRVFTLPERHSVRGRVIDARTRSAVQGGLVWLAEELWGAAVTDASGRFTVSGPGKRSVEILAGAPGYLRASPMDHTLSAEAGPGPTVALEPAAAVEGVVVDESGNPVAGADVTLDVKRDPARIEIRLGREAPAPRAVSSSRGTFRVSSIDPEKNYDLKVSATGFAPSKREIVGLEPQVTMRGLRVELGRGQSVTGVVADGKGKPIRDVEASLRPARPAPAAHGAIMIMSGGAAGAPALKAATDADGRFRIAGLASGAFDLELRRAGFAKKTVSGIDVPKKAEPVDLGSIVLEPGLRIQGIVSAPDGNPIEGAEVSLATPSAGPMMAFMPRRAGKQPAAATTGPDGRFAIEDLPKGEKVSLGFSRAGYLDAPQASIEVPQAVTLEVTMQPASKVSGIVKGPDGKPVPGAQVNLTRTSGGGIGGEVIKMIMRDGATADDEGRFLYDDIRPGQIALSAVAPGLQEAKLDGVEVPEGKDVEGIELPLKAGSIVIGRVLAPDGRAAIGARINPVTDEAEPIRIGGALSDGDGYYRLEGLAPGKVAVEATHDDYVRTVREVEARPGTNTLNLQFEGGQEVSGLVADAAGAPIAGATVSLSTVGRYWGGPETRTGADGTFRLAGVGDGDYSLGAQREGFAPPDKEIPVHVAGKTVTDLKVLLGAGGTIVGNVTGIDPDKLPHVSVRAATPGRGEPASATVDRSGGYKLTGLAPGTWTLTAALAETGQQARGQVALEPGGAEAHLDLEFGKGLTLSGRAVAGDTPIQGAVLFAQNTRVDRSAWGRTDASGSFRIEGLEWGTYQVELRQWETGLSYVESLDLPASREVVLRIPTARIVGRVVDGADRKPLAGVAVSLAGAGGAAPRPGMDRGATSDLTGRFELANVPNGSWTLTAAKTGFAAGTVDASVDSGHDVDDVRLALDATEGLTVEVHLASGRVPDTIDVAVLDGAGRTLTAGSYATGENGRVRLSSVPSGSWELLVSAGGSAVANLRARVPGDPVRVGLPPACGLKVTVPALAGEATAATATIVGADGKPFRELGWMSGAIGEWRLSRGRLEIDTLPPGSWTVQVAAADGRTWSGSSSTHPEATAEVTLQ